MLTLHGENRRIFNAALIPQVGVRRLLGEPCLARGSLVTGQRRALKATPRARGRFLPPPRSGAFSTIQHAPYLGCDLGIGERLEDDLDAGVEPAVMDDRIARISGGEE